MTGHLTEERRQELEPVVRQYARRAFSMALRRYRDRISVQELEQEAWLILATYLRSYDPARGNICPWARRVLYLRLGAAAYRLGRPVRLPRVRNERPTTMDAVTRTKFSSISQSWSGYEAMGTGAFKGEMLNRFTTPADAEAFVIAERAWAKADGDMIKFAEEVRKEMGIETAPGKWKRRR